ncbi:MAG TPA: DUF481 domain-containing protein [Povalibacter sp.]
MVFSTPVTRSVATSACKAIAWLMLTAVSSLAMSAEWEPAPPMPDKFDWVQLKSGEWVKGEIKVMYESSLEFDSEEFELLNLDFADVKEIRSAQVLNVRKRGGDTATGKLLLENSSVKVLGDVPQQFDRADLLSITAGEPTESNYWSGKVLAGGNLSSGNTDEVEASANVKVQRRTVAHRAVFDYLGTYGSSNDVETSNSHRANAVWDWFFSEKLFMRPVFAEYYSDPFQNLDRRVTVGTGLGYQVIDTPKTDWSIFAGPAYQMTRFDQVPVAEDRTDETWAFTGGTSFETDISSQISFIYDYRFQLTSPESGKYNHHMVGTLELDLTESLDFDVSLVWDRIEEPRAEADGTVPEQDDYRLIFSIGYDF